MDKDEYIEYLENIISLMPGNVFWKDRNGVYQGCNKGIMELAGLTNPKQIIGKTLYDFFDKELADSLSIIDEKVMACGDEYCVEEEGLDVKGKQAFYLSRKVPLRDKAGNVIGLLGISIDITERKQMELKVIEAKEQAEAASKAKTEFIMNMSHDMRTPLNGIIGFSQILHKQEVDVSKKQMITHIIDSGVELNKLLTEIIDLSYLEINNVHLKCEPFDLKLLLTNIEKLMIAEALHKKLNFDIIYSDKLPDKILGDKLRLHRILINLIGNAFKFTNQGSITLCVNILQQSKDTIELEFVIKDTGIGISQENLAIIFEKFTRLTLSDRSSYKGAGLGLYIIKIFVDDLKGNIKVESELGIGTTFYCTFTFKY